ncbi:serine/threonine protein kinase [Enhygromyxa salina]|uniref:Serine/threonine protein kinase n=2 Tax=Enhygromyxa salina TaxID=215803 RepID=A0A0C2A1C1_9BACT|nr:serine/threonine protein kinase [Enhygromyxa salina]
MGEVWVGRRAHQTGAYKTVAIKLLTPERAHDEASQRMFDDEARLSMLLCNSNIVQVFDVGEDAGVHYMAMEWVDGMNLDELSSTLRERDETLPLSVVGYIVGEILKALAYAHEFVHEGHERTIVHRDVSAHNVMISVAGEVKLMDFGIARVASEETSGIHVKGKLRYMPPEQLRGDARAPTIDLFAVGAILHELLDGQRFRSGVVDEARLYGMVLDGEVPPLTCASERVPGEVEVLRSHLLRADATERIQSAREAHRCLSVWSGYRDAKFELQDLVRGCVSPASSGTESISVSHVSRSRPRPLRTDSHAARTRPHVSLSSPQNLKTDPLASRATSRSSSARAETDERSIFTQVLPPPARANVFLASLVALPLLVLVLFGAGLVWLAFPRRASSVKQPLESSRAVEAEPPAVVDTTVVVPRPIEGAGAPLPHPSNPELSAPAPTSVASEPPNSPEVIEPPPNIEQHASESAKIFEPQPPPRVSVMISAPTVFWIEIQIGGRIHSLDRMGAKTQARARLRPGTYQVRYRNVARGAWRSGGTVTIPDTRESLHLMLQQSGKFKIE